MDEIGQLKEVDGRFEFRHDGLGLVVRGDHPEWVLMAAAEVISSTARIEGEAELESLTALAEFEEVSGIEVDSAKFALKQRFETIPQCIVSLGKIDYKWATAEGREKLTEEYDGHMVRRIHDMSLTFNDSFLDNEDGVEMND
ncbi:hypothetical protein GQ651_08835 [Alphaproteobacteria bacterium GH1-50]|uniref:Uncharacterized protein n=1 Tax=Kangsaoukella pontilimi TaxID=2691042 RepID=A0A7C9IP93_9RHOB|nr:hypothetical protein [Kangsaoukella pontilimi]MXQ07950.1 hypothetical protein [Kangsaoukella pontilimi]